jgi:hypothetical protein
MARRVLRVASIGVAGGAGFGVAFGAWYMLNAIESWVGPPPRMAGLLAGWAVIVWLVSVLVAGFAIWSWRAPFKTAAIGMTIAGAITGYWAIIYFGHDQAMFVACAVVTMIVLGSTAAAVALSARRAGAASRHLPPTP